MNAFTHAEKANYPVPSAWCDFLLDSLANGASIQEAKEYWNKKATPGSELYYEIDDGKDWDN